MKRKTTLIFLVCLLAALPLRAGDTTPMAGELFPDIRLPMPERADHLAYLGLSGSQSFAVSQIQAETLVIEIFNMYCPHCQREAPAVNAFYSRIEKTPALKGKIKVIGIGVGNSPFEVDHFRKVYQVPFPLFPDGDYAIHKRLGEVRTPYFFGLKLGKSGPARVFYSQLGGAKSAEKLLEDLLSRANEPTEGSPK
ncbi:MAG: redoxin domain-containing protein [Desulfobacterales bacterium]|jgi:peroxiredoxin